MSKRDEVGSLRLFSSGTPIGEDGGDEVEVTAMVLDRTEPSLLSL